jgi:hypothetical protein
MASRMGQVAGWSRGGGEIWGRRQGSLVTGDRPGAAAGDILNKRAPVHDRDGGSKEAALCRYNKSGWMIRINNRRARLSFEQRANRRTPLATRARCGPVCFQGEGTAKGRCRPRRVPVFWSFGGGRQGGRGAVGCDGVRLAGGRGQGDGEDREQDHQAWGIQHRQDHARCSRAITGRPGQPGRRRRGSTAKAVLAH